MLARYMLSSCLSVRLSQGGIVSKKRLDKSSGFLVEASFHLSTLCYTRKCGYLPKLGYFFVGLCPKLRTSKIFRHVASKRRSRYQQHSLSSTVEFADDTYTTIDESWLFTASQLTVILLTPLLRYVVDL